MTVVHQALPFMRTPAHTSRAPWNGCRFTVGASQPGHWIAPRPVAIKATVKVMNLSVPLMWRAVLATCERVGYKLK
jgi:hypothetical protein